MRHLLSPNVLSHSLYGRQATAARRGGAGAEAPEAADGKKTKGGPKGEEEEEESDEQWAAREATAAVEAPLLSAYARTTHALAGLLQTMDNARSQRDASNLPPEVRR
jgi:hypothetical protein